MIKLRGSDFKFNALDLEKIQDYNPSFNQKKRQKGHRLIFFINNSSLSPRTVWTERKIENLFPHLKLNLSSVHLKLPLKSCRKGKTTDFLRRCEVEGGEVSLRESEEASRLNFEEEKIL